MRLPTVWPATAATLLVMCLEPVPKLPADLAETEELLIGKGPDPSDAAAADDELLIGRPKEWPHGRPTLREEMWRRNDARKEPEVIVISIDDLRARDAADKADRFAAIVSVLSATSGSAAAATADAKRCFKLCAGLKVLSAETTRERLSILAQALPDAHARRRVLLGAPSLLLHVNLAETLPRKLAALAMATGQAAERTCAAAPGLLLLDHEQLESRLARLRDALPDELSVHLPRMLRRYPRLLSRRPEVVRAAYEALVELLPPTCDVARAVGAYPSLLATSPDRLRAKVDTLRRYCTEAEWHGVWTSASLGRVLTVSDAVLERLRRGGAAEAPSDGGAPPRPVVRTLLMAKREWSRRQAASGR